MTRDNDEKSNNENKNFNEVSIETDNNKYIPITNKFLDKDFHFKSHSLIFCSLDLSAVMRDIMAMMLTKMDYRDWFDHSGNEATPSYCFDADQVSKFLNIEKKKHIATKLRYPSSKLASTKLGVFDDNKFRFIPLLSDISYFRGIFTIVPNKALRQHYLIKAQEKNKNGFAKIQNDILVSLHTSPSKILYEWLCRFSDGKKLYPYKISNMMYFFGVYGENGECLKKSYKSPRRFIQLIIKPAIQVLSESEALKNKLRFNIGKYGNCGFTAEANSDDWLITFEYDWLDENGDVVYDQEKKIIEDKKKAQALERIKQTIENQKELKEKKKELSIDELLILETDLLFLGYDQQAIQTQNKIKELKKKIAINKQLADKNILEKEEKVKQSISSTLDDLFNE